MGDQRARSGSASSAVRRVRKAALAAESVREKPGIEYICRAHTGSVANPMEAKVPHAGRAGVNTCTQPGIGGTNSRRTPSEAAGVRANEGRIATKYASRSATV